MHSPAVKKMDKSIEKLEADLQKLRDEREAMVKMPANQRLAIELHGSTCTWNHTDGCSWFYEFKDGIHDWNGNEHRRRLDAANRILGKMKQRGIEEDLVPALVEIVLANKG